MRIRRTSSHAIGGAAVTALGLAALVLATGSLEARPAQAQPNARTPLRAVFFVTAPNSGKALAGRPAPTGPQSGAAALKAQLAALDWAGAAGAIVPWSRGSSADRRFGKVLAAVASRKAHVRVAALIDRGRAAAQIRALARSRARSRSYLRIGSRSAVFVALSNRRLRTCAAARRWRAAAKSFWLAQGTFPGYLGCRAAADAWFRDVPDSRSARATGTFLIRPGYWPSRAEHAVLPRAAARWRRAIEQMNASKAPLQLIDSLNDWQRGTAIEPAAAWPSASGFGTYLDELHALPASGVQRRARPSVADVKSSALTAHSATLTATVAAGSATAAWMVEYGATTAYGQITAPQGLPAGSPSRVVSIVIPSLTAATSYHARVAVASPLGRVTSKDVKFTTPAASGQAVRIAAAGDIACDPSESSFNGGAGTDTGCQQLRPRTQSSPAAMTRSSRSATSSTTPGRRAGSRASTTRAGAGSNPSRTPSPGNHEYGSPERRPTSSIRRLRRHAGQGWYTFDLGSWHLIALNSNCAQVGGCAAGSPQELCLRSDLAAHAAKCVLAYWHHPLFTSGRKARRRP